MMRMRFYLVYVLLILTALFVGNRRDVLVPLSQPLEDIPVQIGSWVQADQVFFSEAVLDGLRPTDYLYRVYRQKDAQPAATMSFYLGYHGGGPDSGPIHSPKHCLPGSGWMLESEQNRTVAVGQKQVAVVEAIYRHDDRRELFVYWYQVRGETLTSEYALKFSEVFNSMLYRRRDTAFIRISTQYQDGDLAPHTLVDQFVRELYPHIDKVLPH